MAIPIIGYDGQDEHGGHTFRREGADPLYVFGPDADAMAAQWAQPEPEPEPEFLAPNPYDDPDPVEMVDVDEPAPGRLLAGKPEVAPGLQTLDRLGDVNDPNGQGVTDPNLMAGVADIQLTPVGGGSSGPADLRGLDPARVAEVTNSTVKHEEPKRKIVTVSPKGNPAPQQGNSSDAIVRAHLLKPRYYGGQAAYDPVAHDQSLQTVRQTQTTVRDGLDPESAQALMAAHDDILGREVEAKKKATDIAKRVYGSQGLHYRLQADALEADEDEAQNDVKRMLKRVDEDRAKLAEIDDKIANGEIDTDRIWKGRTAARIGAAIAQAVGAFVAIRRGNPNMNFAKQIIDQAVENDIREQEQNIRTNTAARNNLLKELQLQFGDLDQAKEAYRVVAAKRADLMMQSQVSMAKSQGADSAFEQWMLEREKERLAKVQSFTEKSIGKQTIHSKFEAPRKATRGGRSAPSLDQVVERGKKLGLTPEESLAYFNVELNKSGAAGESPVDAKNVQAYGKARTAVEKAAFDARTHHKRLKELAAKYGGTLPGVNAANTGIVGSMTEMALKAAAAAGDQKAQDALEVKQRIQGMRNALIATNKGPASDQDVERLNKQMVGNGGTKGVMRAIEQGIGLLDATRKHIDATYGVPVVGAYERNLAKVEKRNAANKPKAPLKPMQVK